MKREGGSVVQALVFHGPGDKKWESKSDPKIENPTDAIVKIDTTTICGTDLHILKGDVPAVTDGRTLGHEAVGTVVETGAAVMNAREGDKVLVSCISACGRCGYCKRGCTASASTGAVGSWAIWWMGCRPSTRGYRSPTTASTRFRRGSPMSRCCTSPTFCRRVSRSGC